MIQLELPNVDDTQDPVVQKLIKAVQELADQSSSFDTAIFNEMNMGIKRLDKRMLNLETGVSELKDTVTHGFQEMTNKFDSLESGLSQNFKSLEDKFDQKIDDLRESLENKLEEKLDEQTKLLQQIAKNTEK